MDTLHTVSIVLFSRTFFARKYAWSSASCLTYLMFIIKLSLLGHKMTNVRVWGVCVRVFEREC